MNIIEEYLNEEQSGDKIDFIHSLNFDFPCEITEYFLNFILPVPLNNGQLLDNYEQTCYYKEKLSE